MKFFLCILLTLTKVLTFQVHLDNVMIETIDITVDEYNDDNNNTIKNKIEAFKSTNNDQIIKNNQTSRYGELEWHSIGFPFLTNIHLKNSSLSFDNLFQITPNGFNIFIEFLSDVQKRAIIEKIKIKYGIDVHSSQIIKLMLSELTCSIELYCDNQISEESIKLKGSSNVFSKFPIKVEFKELDKKTKTCFDQYLVEHQNVDIHCIASRNSNKVKKNYFSIIAEEKNTNDLVDKLFEGDGDENYVSREQLLNLANEIYASLNVYTEYEMPEDEFSSKFIQEIIKQTNSSFKSVPLKEAFSSLSKYTIKDFDPNMIESNYGDILKVKKTGSKEHIIVDKELANSYREKNSSDRHLGANYMNIGGKKSYEYVKNRENNWAKSGKSLQDQLKELNDFSKGEIEWEIVKKRIIPKSLKLVKLVKSNFVKGLKFVQIEQLITDKIQVKSFKVEYKDAIKYQRLPNQIVDKNSSIKILKQMKSVKTLWSCLKMCESNNRCQYSEYYDISQECYLYNKMAHFHIIPSNESIQVNLYKKRMYSPKELQGIKIIDKDFMTIEEVADSDSCWEECLKQETCHMVNYKYDNGECYLYEDISSESIQTIVDQKYITVCYEKEDRFKLKNTIKIIQEVKVRNQIDHSKYTRYNKTQISGLYLSLNMESEEACLEECIMRRICIAISFGENRCHLVKKGEYQHHRFNDWVSIYLENEAPIISENINSTYTAKRTLNAHESWIQSLAILQNGDLASCSNDKTIKIWNPTDGALKQTINSHDLFVNTLAVLHNGNLVSGSSDRTIKIWNSEKYDVERTLTNHTDSVDCLTVFPNTDFASGSYDNTIIIWSSNGEYKRTLHGHTSWVHSLVVLSSGKLASGSNDNTIKIWSADGNLENTLSGHSSMILSLVVLENGFLVSGSRDRTAKIWNDNGELIYTHNTNNHFVEALGVLPNGDLLIGLNHGEIRIQDKNKIVSQEAKSVLRGHSDLKSTLNSFAIFSNGDFASASEDKTIVIWSQN